MSAVGQVPDLPRIAPAALGRSGTCPTSSVEFLERHLPPGLLYTCILREGEQTHEISDCTSTIDDGRCTERGERYLRRSRQGSSRTQQRRPSGHCAGSSGLGQPSRQGGSS